MIGMWLPWREEDNRAQVRGRRGEVTFSDRRHHSSYPARSGHIDMPCNLSNVDTLGRDESVLITVMCG